MASEQLTLDSGALIAIERGSRRVQKIVDESIAAGHSVHVVAGVLAQTWRGGSRQARLAAFLNGVEVEIQPFDEDEAKAVGEICARTGKSDVVDAHVVYHARRHDHVVVTSDPDDLRAIDPGLVLIEV